MATAELHVTDAASLLGTLARDRRTVSMTLFSPPYSLKCGRYGSATVGAYPGEPASWASFTAALMVEAASVCDGAVFAVVDSPLDKKGRYRPAVERLAVALDDSPAVRLLRPQVWSKNGAPGSVYWPSHCFEWVVGCCRAEVARPYYSWQANASPAKFSSGAGRQRNADGTRRDPAKTAPVKGRPARPGDVLRVTVGGGNMGRVGPDGKIVMADDKLATSGEAPFPWKLADWLVGAFCPPGGTVLDICMGTGTTAVAALASGRSFVGCDVRESQVHIARRRLELAGFTPEVFGDERSNDGKAC